MPRLCFDHNLRPRFALKPRPFLYVKLFAFAVDVPPPVPLSYPVPNTYTHEKPPPVQ